MTLFELDIRDAMIAERDQALRVAFGGAALAVYAETAAAVPEDAAEPNAGAAVADVLCALAEAMDALDEIDLECDDAAVQDALAALAFSAGFARLTKRVRAIRRQTWSCDAEREVFARLARGVKAAELLVGETIPIGSPNGRAS